MNTPTDIPALTQRYPDRQLRVHCHPERYVVHLDNSVQLQITLQPVTPQVMDARVSVLNPAAERLGLLAALEAVFSTLPALRCLNLHTPASPTTQALVAEGLLRAHGLQAFTCHSEAFWQYSPSWTAKTSCSAYPQQFVVTDGKRHPLRPQPATSVLYSRYLPWLGQTLTLQQADPDRDLHAFNRWMNSPRVAQFWEEEGSLEQHHAYLSKQLADPHSLPLIGRFDGQPFGYFEVYWAKEDRIAPFYEAGDYDRGLHLLVGEEAFRGQAFYTAWFSSICHFMFLDDPRTQRLVCEPRHDNQRQIANFDRSGFAKVKHFDFPHKRALLVMLTRERFFSERLYQPLDSIRPSKEGTTV